MNGHDSQRDRRKQAIVEIVGQQGELRLSTVQLRQTFRSGKALRTWAKDFGLQVEQIKGGAIFRMKQAA